LSRVIIWACLALALVLTTHAHAQVITATVRGTVTFGEDGSPLVDAQVTLHNDATGFDQTTQTNTDGEYVFTGVQIGGPYRIRAEADGYKTVGQTGLYLSAGKTRDIKLRLQLDAELIEVSSNALPRNTSNRTVITSEQIDQMPSISRDPRDLVRLTPEASVEGSDHTMSIGGANNRYNSITVDGIREDDDFGLNSSGYPTRRSPIGLSAIQEMTVESAPFDVRYSKFMGGNVNIVTKSGTNDVHGELFATYASDALMGKQIGNIKLTNTKFREARGGVALGGPLVKDKLHFFVSVEGLDATSPVNDGPLGSSAVNITQKVTQAEMEMAQQIAQSVYHFNAGVPNRALDETDLKLFSKVDYEINDKHRFVASYQRTAGTQDSSSASTASQLSLSSNWYDEKDTLHTFSGTLFSNWSDKLSTQLQVNGKLVSSRPTPLNGNGFMAAQIRTPEGGTILLGPDDFRHTNFLDNDLLHGKFEANYLASSHLLTGGLEYERLYIDNVFIADTNGGAVYQDLASFAALAPSQITYSNAVTLNPKDGEANWSIGTLAAYAQDQWRLTDDLTVQGGLRLETLQTGDRPTYNDNFDGRNGFPNTATLNGKSILMPRFGASYLATPELNLRAGGGLYSGGTPTVWVSNGYSNDGVRIGNAFSKDPNVIDGFDGRNVPAGLRSMVAAGNGNVDALDPSFKIPSTWKAGTGADYEFMPQGILKVNYTYSKVYHAVTWIDKRRDLASLPDNLPVGTTPDGRPEYDINGFNPHRGYDMLLTNTDQGYGHVATLALEKSFPYGLFVSGTYAYERVYEVNPANSSRSVSNYDNVAVTNPQNPGLAISNYEREHRFTLSAQFSRALFEDVTDAAMWKGKKTTIGVFAELRSGQPYTWTFSDADFGNTLGKIFGEDATFASHDRELFYVPKGDGSDVILNGIDPTAFNKWLKDTGLDKYRGRIVPRNAFSSPWYKRIDLRFAQDLPGVYKGRAKFMIDIQNLGNLIDHNWGRSQSVPFPYATPAVDVAIDPATGKYVYSNLRPANANITDVLGSVWHIGLGLMYDF
jgi:hypothetical protein